MVEGKTCQSWEAGSGVAVGVAGIGVTGADVGVGATVTGVVVIGGDAGVGVGSSPQAVSTAVRTRQERVAVMLKARPWAYRMTRTPPPKRRRSFS